MATVEGYTFGLDDDQIARLSEELGKLLKGEFPEEPQNTVIAPSNDQLIGSDKEQVWRKAVGEPPKQPSEETDVKFAVLVDLLSSNTNPKELRLQLERLASVSKEMMEWREYELRAEAARKVYARMEQERFNHPWNVFKRKVKGWIAGRKVSS